MKFKHTYILLIATTFILGCRQTKYVPEGEYLLKKNIISESGGGLDKADLSSIIRQQPNYKRVGVKWKLMAFNLVDSSKVAEKRLIKNEKIALINKGRIIRQEKINSKRRDKARNKGRSHYTERIILLKDTLEYRMFFREWYKYKIGHAPVVFDSILFNKSIEQLSAYMKRKGYYDGVVKASVDYHENKKCVVSYDLTTGLQFKIDSVYVVGDNPVVLDRYHAFLKQKDDHRLFGKPFDSELLDDHRSQVSEYMRDKGVYGFSVNHISFTADTIKETMSVSLGVHLGDRLVKSSEHRDSVDHVPHQKTFINKVYYHIADTLNFPGSFSAYMKSKGLEQFDGQFLKTVDTTFYTKVLDKKTNSIDVSRVAIFTHNGPLFINPRVLEVQNYLEVDKMYSEKKLEKTYLSLLQLDLFQSVKIVLLEVDGPGCIDAHYYLVPRKKQRFSFAPIATNSNGYLGVAATANYTNQNLFKGAEKLTVSLSGGFESQPPIFDETIDGDKIQTAARSFNTFEIGPSVKLEIPGLFPFRVNDQAKKMRPKTIVSTAYNFQKRTDFSQGTFQMNYLWQFFAKKTMIFQSGFPLGSVIKYVNIEKSNAFEEKLNQINDLFLLNAYSDQLVWQDWKFTFEYNINEKKNRKGNAQLNFKSSFDPAGNLLSLFKKHQDTIDGQHTVFGIGYAQFARLDNNVVYSKPIRKDQSLNFRLTAGGGMPYGNSKASLPYDYSFFAGGANDNRGWRTRALGPGSYKYYLDTNRTATQIGDIRFGASAEFRFSFNSLFKGALFVDAGNIWTIEEDVNRIGGQFSSNWYKEIAIAGGFGLRMDLEYFIIRVDLGFPIMNPALPEGSKWIFQSRDNYYQEGIDAFGEDNYQSYLPLPFIPTFHFGIGYPF
ncbi:MAG: BamA/TamA family outer membrane protein [Crocinitomicaceae bacterium]|nr:BamA/TamA family outer membrane protein [Crocinitomicaceae bacterium]MDG1777092.1 BamA/TamA family outer membrane protein [Crocinitomicaceae bacterium]